VNVLVIDVGGTSVKMLATGQAEPRKFDSGPTLTPAELVKRVGELAADWKYSRITLGIPALIGPDGPEAEPGNLGDGWVGFDFQQAFGKPTLVVNDAAMQALGAYDGGRMLFLGLGTGLGSALVTDQVVVPLELGSLPFSREETMAERVGKDGLHLHGEEEWQHSVRRVLKVLQAAFEADYVVLGGGNAVRVEPLPDGVRRGGNDDAFAGGFRLWEERVVPHDLPPSAAWRVVR
jgi:predicted NBD/HSP70 family sugar kinase